MALTRRAFVARAATAAGAMSAALALPKPGTRAVSSLERQRARASCTILDLGDDCALRESVNGFGEALAGLGAVSSAVIPSDSDVPGRDGVTIVPGALVLGAAAIRCVASQLDAGGTVILESGAAFAGERAVADHRDMLRQCFGLHVGAPTSLWSTEGQRSVPFVHYTWPASSHVRDFSRALPIECGSGSMIARAGDHAVATRTARGRGTLVFLGSPIGPALRAGDREARRWLAAVLTESARGLV